MDKGSPMKALFVDDEVQVLRGIRRMLNADDNDWDAEFVGGGQEALEVLEQQQFDVIVTDMRMPGMNGAELLEHVSLQHPDVVRIVLSGHADRSAVFRATRPMHQYLAKPCDTETLRSTIHRAFVLREVLQSTSLQQLVSQLESLPTLPSLYTEVVNEIESEDGSLERVGQIIEQDPGMTAKILQVANSAMFGIPTSVTSAGQAASLLGMETIKSLVVSVGIFRQVSHLSIPGFCFDYLYRHSLEVGTRARAIARLENGDQDLVSQAFTAGLLHDIGKLVFACSLTEEYSEFLQSHISPDESRDTLFVESETAALGASHSAVGAYLLALWGLPQPIVEAVAFHHTPESTAETTFSPLSAVVAANCLSRSEVSDREDELEQCQRHLEQIGCADRLAMWKQATERSPEEEQ